MSAASVVEAVLGLAPFAGLAWLVWRDPSGHYAAEVKRRKEENR